MNNNMAYNILNTMLYPILCLLFYFRNLSYFYQY